MTNDPNSGNSPEPDTRPNPPNRPSRRRRILGRVGLGLGLTAFVGIVIGARQAWIFINEDLAPLIEKNLAQTLNRPVDLGAVEGVSFTGLSFGPSALPPTATDQDQIKLEAVNVQFNLIELALTRTLRLNLTLVEPTIFVDQDKDGVWIKTQLQSQESEGPIKTELDVVRVENATVVLAPAPQLTAESGEPAGFQDTAQKLLVTFRNFNGIVTFRDRNKRISFDLAGLPSNGGNLRLRGEANVTTKAVNILAQGQNLLASDVGSLLPLPLSLKAGRLAANLELRVEPDKPLAFNGTANFQNVTAQIVNVPNQFSQANGTLRFQGQRIQLENVRARYGTIPARASGTIHTQNGYNLSAQVRSLSVADLTRTFALPPLPVPITGQLNADLRLTGALNQPLITGTAVNSSQVRVDRVNIARVSTQFRVTPRYLAFEQTRVTPVGGGQVTGGGRLTFGEQGGLNFAFQGRNLPGDAIARSYGLNSPNIRVGRVGADVTVTGPTSAFQAYVRWRAPGATYPGQGDILLTRDVIRAGNTRFQVAGGTIRASAVVTQGRWQAFVDTSEIRLNQFSQQLQGLLSGQFRLSGSLSALNLRGVRAQGQVRLSDGISYLDRPLTASLQWTGDRILIQRATAPGFNASGYVLAQLEGRGAPAISSFNLDVNLQNFDLAALPLPPQSDVAGRLNFNGQVTGTPTVPVVAGRVGLNNFRVNDLVFEPVLAGNVRYAGGQGLNLNLVGEEDRIALVLDSRNRPQSFLIRQDEVLAEGQGQGDRLLATLQNFPLEILNLNPATAQGLGEVGGRVNGRFDINLADLQNPSVVGDVAIARPSLGYISADSFTGQFRYANGAGVLNNGELRRGTSRYLLAGTVQPGATPQFTAKITADQGQVQDILTAFQWFSLQDLRRGIGTPRYQRAANVQTLAISTFGYTILNQLRRYSEIVALLDQQQTEREQASFLPDLAKLQGGFSGTIDIAGSAQNGVSADFNLQGQNWTWDQYGVDQVVAEGSFESGVLTLLPLRLQGVTYAPVPQTETAFVSFSGQVGGDQQSGQLRIENIPVQAVRDLFRVRLNLTGNLNVTATLTGSQRNPEVVGEIEVANGRLNGTPVQDASTIFGYSGARLNFSSRVVVAEPEPLTLVGSIPYRFEFMDPTLNPGEAISLRVDVRNEGLSLLNLLTNRQFSWDGGEGAVELEVGGTLSAPLATGVARFENARFSALALPEPITNVAGVILFNRDRIQVQSLQGQFSDGQITAQGLLPIFNPLNMPPPDDGVNGNGTSPGDATNPGDGSTGAGNAPGTGTGGSDPVNAPLSLNLTDIALNFKGLYRGGVNGQVIVTGTALAPRIGGEIILSNGRVLLPSSGSGSATTVADTSTEEGFTSPPRLNNLQLTLGNNLLVTLEPILNFVARGQLTINGTLGALRPSGTIRLLGGQVNLFTTQFNLARNYESTAQFLPERGLDPLLDVRLTTSVIEVTRAPSQFQTATPYASSEVADQAVGDYGAFQTVRVQASVVGPASELFDNLELSSSPNRTENELIGLLGGSFVNTLGQGDGTLAIANLAGSALLTRVQNAIGNALGLSEFRLFPTTNISDDERTSTLGLAAEVGVDLTGNLSASALQILTDDVPTQFNLRYRISDEILLRGSSDFSGDNRVVLEYQTRF